MVRQEDDSQHWFISWCARVRITNDAFCQLYSFLEYILFQIYSYNDFIFHNWEPHVYQYIAGSSIIHEYVWIKQLKNDKSIIHIGRWTHMRHPIYHPYRTDAMGVYCGYMRIPIFVQTCLTRNGYNMVKFSQNRTHHGSSARDKMWCIFVSLKVDWFARYNIGVVYNM